MAGAVFTTPSAGSKLKQGDVNTVRWRSAGCGPLVKLEVQLEQDQARKIELEKAIKSLEAQLETTQKAWKREKAQKELLLLRECLTNLLLL